MLFLYLEETGYDDTCSILVAFVRPAGVGLAWNNGAGLRMDTKQILRHARMNGKHSISLRRTDVKKS